MKSILVTGGAGFIGSNFVIYFLEKYPDYKIINLDKLTYAGDMENLSEVKKNPSHVFIKGDICNRKLVEKIFSEHDIQGVIHFAAESHVDNSIKRPEEFIKTNVMGTFTLIDVAYKTWMEGPFKFKEAFQKCRFHHISTDEVYGSLGETGFFTEDTPYAPNSPYSASKAGSDMIVRSYNKTFGMNITISNCSNNFGPRQHSEKLIPTIIRKAICNEPIPIYGKGTNVRDWLYVLDHCKAIDIIFHEGKFGETYNIGANCEKTNIEIAKVICRILDKLKPSKDLKNYEELITFVKDRPGHDLRYAIDSKKIGKELGWEAETNFIDGLKKTVEWYQINEK